MKTLSLAAIAGALLTLIFAAQPASAAIRCGCPPVVHHHHVVHRAIRRHIVYRHVAVRQTEYVDVYLDAPPPPPMPEAVWDDYGPYDAAPQWDPQGRFEHRAGWRRDDGRDYGDRGDRRDYMESRGHVEHRDHVEQWDHADPMDHGAPMDHGDQWRRWDHENPEDDGR